MEWFKHDSNASNDAKLKKLIIRYGVTGYAIYFHCLELICGDVNKNNLTFQLEHDSEIIADNLKINGTSEQSGREVVEEIMRYIVSLGLFQSDGSRIFCTKLLHRIDTSMTSNTKFREMITEAKNHDTVMIPSCKKEENRSDQKEKNKIDETIEAEFDAFWKAYNKSAAKKPCHTKYKTLYKNKSLPNIQEHVNIINKWKATDKWKDGYQPNPLTWLNQERWNDELPVSTQPATADYVNVAKPVCRFEE